MNTIPSPHPGNEKSPDERPERILPPEIEPNITNGGEFLDDALRMREQPFGETLTKKPVEDSPASHTPPSNQGNFSASKI